jgi:hypothetical protein
MDWGQVESRVRDDELESLDAFEKGTQEAPTLYRPISFQVEKASGDDGLMRFVASTEDKDRAGDVIRQNWELTNFKQNPVYMWSHDYSREPIGTVPRVWVENAKTINGGPALMNLVKFDDQDEFARSVKGKFERGVLKAQSVGFRPVEFEVMRDDEGSFNGFEFTQNELLEISAVSIPMNQAALRKAIELAGKAPVVFFMEPPHIIKAASEPETVVETDTSDEVQFSGSITELAEKVREIIADVPEPVQEIEPVQAAELDSEPATELSLDDSTELANALRAVTQED